MIEDLICFYYTVISSIEMYKKKKGDNPLSILKLNNKIITLGGSVVTAIDYPVKGELINMDLDGNGNKTYRVLSIDGKVAKVLGMNDIEYNQNWSNGTTCEMGTLTVLQYADSTLDTYFNTTWYNTLNNVSKEAIVPKTITQDAWYLNSFDQGSPIYTGTCGDTVPGTENCVAGKYATAELTIGNRNVYALSVQEVIDYLSDENMRVDKSAILRNVNIWKMFWNIEMYPSSMASLWLRSAIADDRRMKAYACRVRGSKGAFDSGRYSGSQNVRPAFQIDLSKIPFTKTTEVIS